MQPKALPVLLTCLLMIAGAQSTHAGVNVWTSLGPDGGYAGGLAVEPGTRAVFAASRGGVFRSADRGASWERRNRGLSELIFQVAFATAPVRTVYAAGEENAYRSTDAGATWTPLFEPQLASDGYPSVAVDADDASLVYLGSFFHGVLKSNDGGATWAPTTQFPCGTVWSLALDPRDPATVYAGCSREDVSPIFKSTDGGATWTPKSSGLPAGSTAVTSVQVALAPDSPGTLFLSLTQGNTGIETFRSRDGGDHWTKVGPGGLPLAVGSAGRVFAGTHRSTDGGASWTEIGALPAAPASLAIDPAAPQTVYASAGFFGAFKSLDGGTTWTSVNQGLRPTLINALAIDPQHTSTLYTVALGLGLRKTVSGGSRWLRADKGLPSLDGYAFGPVVAVDPVTPARVYAGWQTGFARSEDGGASWTVLQPEGQCVGVGTLAIDPLHPANLYGTGLLSSAACGQGGSLCPVFRSSDSGASWTCIAPPGVTYADKVVVDPVEPSRIYAVSVQGGAWRSIDRGSHWHGINGGLRNDPPVTLALDPSDPRRVYLGTLKRLLKSTDRGETWTESGHGLPADVVHTIVVNPKNPQNVFAGGNFGVYITANAGRTWFPMNGGLPGFTWQLVLDPKNPNKLYAGTASSVYTYERK